MEEEKEVDKKRDGEGQIVGGWERENESSSGRKDKAKREQEDTGKDEIIEGSFVESHWVCDMSIPYPPPGCVSSFDSCKNALKPGTNPVYINKAFNTDTNANTDLNFMDIFRGA